MHIEVQVTEGTPAAERVAAALSQLGADLTTQNGTLRAVARTGVCVVCAGAFAVERLQTRDALGGLTCPTCAQVADRVMAAFKAAALRHARELRGQLPQIIRDVRGGADVPTFYQGFE